VDSCFRTTEREARKDPALAERLRQNRLRRVVGCACGEKEWIGDTCLACCCQLTEEEVTELGKEVIETCTRQVTLVQSREGGRVHLDDEHHESWLAITPCNLLKRLKTGTIERWEKDEDGRNRSIRVARDDEPHIRIFRGAPQEVTCKSCIRVFTLRGFRGSVEGAEEVGPEWRSVVLDWLRWNSKRVLDAEARITATKKRQEEMTAECRRWRALSDEERKQEYDKILNRKGTP